MSVDDITKDSGSTSSADNSDTIGTDGADGRQIELKSNGTYIQWRYEGDTEWNNLMPLSEITGNAGTNGTDGREIELQSNGEYIQWRYEGDTEWNNLMPLSEITGNAGANGTNGTNGTDGREIELQSNGTYIQWRYEGDTEWKDLMPLTDITGPAGATGATGAAGADGTVLAYAQFKLNNQLSLNSFITMGTSKNSDDSLISLTSDGTGVILAPGHYYYVSYSMVADAECMKPCTLALDVYSNNTIFSRLYAEKAQNDDGYYYANFSGSFMCSDRTVRFKLLSNDYTGWVNLFPGYVSIMCME